MRPALSVVSVSFVSLLSACGGVPLADFNATALEVHCLVGGEDWFGDDCQHLEPLLKGRPGLFLSNGYKVADGTCTLSPSARATLNGVPLQQISAGGENHLPSCTGPDCTRCVAPAWVFDRLPTGSPAVFEVIDGATRVRASFQTLFDSRDVALRSPSEPRAGNGTQVAFDWKPSSDACENVDALFYSEAAVEAPSGAFPKGSVQIWSATWAPDATISFPVFLDTDAVKGTGTLVIRAQCIAKVNECQGVPSCTAAVASSPTAGVRPSLPFTLE